MTESDFFLQLEGRITRECSGMRDPKLRRFWCDGFIPEEFEVVGKRSRITGRVWIDDGNGRQTCWNFALLLGDKALNREKIRWDEMLPGEDVTGWLFVDFHTKFMKVHPAAAHPDPESQRS